MLFPHAGNMTFVGTSVVFLLFSLASTLTCLSACFSIFLGFGWYLCCLASSSYVCCFKPSSKGNHLLERHTACCCLLDVLSHGLLVFYVLSVRFQINT